MKVRANQPGSNAVLEFARRIIAAALLLTGLYLAAFGNAWAPIVLEWLSGSQIGAWVELIVPFLPMVFISIAAVLFTSSRGKTNATRGKQIRG
jgi:hypothetical protein